MKLIDKLAWIEIKGKSVLSTKSYGKEVYYLPGGKREHAETDLQALVREIKEELSVDLDPETAAFIGIFQAHAHGHAADVFVKMTCYAASYDGMLSADSEIEEILWLNYADREKVSAVDKIIFDYLKEKNLID